MDLELSSFDDRLSLLDTEYRNLVSNECSFTDLYKKWDAITCISSDMYEYIYKKVNVSNRTILTDFCKHRDDKITQLINNITQHIVALGLVTDIVSRASNKDRNMNINEKLLKEFTEGSICGEEIIYMSPFMKKIQDSAKEIIKMIIQ